VYNPWEDSMTTQAVAEPNVGKNKPGKPKGEPTWLNKPKQPVAAQLRSSPEYKQWLDELCKVDHRSISDLLEFAIAKHAASIGFREPPER
jgi:hypothetical protein